MRVMQVVLSLAPGGTERLVIEIVRRLRGQSFESVVCCLDDEGAWARELRQMGVSVVALRRREGFSPTLGYRLARLIAAHRIQVVHCHHYSPFVYGQLAALLAPGVGVVFTEHGRLSNAPPSRKRRLINPILGRLPSAVFAVSDDLRRHMIAEGFTARRVQVIHNGIDIGHEVRADERRAARTTLGLPAEALVIGTVARLDPVKDLTTLVEAFARVRAQLATARLVMIGDGPERARIHDHVARLGLSDHVLMAGARNDVRVLLPAFDIYVNSSIHEGISLTILEAMAASLPVVATQVGGNPEVIGAGTGALTPCQSVDGLAAALLTFAGDPERRQIVGDAARTRVRSSFSIDRMVAQYIDSYRRARGGTAPSGNVDR
jgi:glycosyltransferase involved in cell wall biosynthesis